MSSRKYLVLSFASCLVLFATQARALVQPRASDCSPTVTIASGIVLGKQTNIATQPSIRAIANAYLGVPYARSPPLRFAPPEAVPSWSTPLQAQAVKAACIQQFSTFNALGGPSAEGRAKTVLNNPGLPPPQESEDCLYVNVWTPANVTRTSKKAVMFYIFGGDLSFGQGAAPIYDGSSLAIMQDVVVVTFNSRTNIFGFSNSPEIPFGSQNAGLLDERYALKWVTDNIVQFGGDPSNVTVWGQSSGAASVKQLLANPPLPLPFKSAIIQSELIILNGDGKTNFQKVLSHFHCADLHCLRGIDAFAIRDYIEKADLSFHPVNGDGTYTNDVRPSIRFGNFAKVPILIGSDLNEIRIFLDILGITDGSTAIEDVLSMLGLNTTVGQSLVAQYAMQGITSLYDVADRIGTDFLFTCTTSTLARFLARHGYGVHRYRFDASFPSTTLFPKAGAYHGSEIPSIFGNYPLPATQQQISLSAYMQRTWANFAKGMTPNWPAVGEHVTSVVGILGKDGSSGVTAQNTATIDYMCGLDVPLEDALGLSYK